MIISSFCGVVTLQVGTATLAVVYLLISVLVIEINAFDYSNDPLNSWPIPLMLLSIFAILMVITGIFIFFCAYSESRTMCVVAVVCLILIWLYWIILSGLSFTNKPSFTRRICHGHRCPESFWMANFHYRGCKEEKQMLSKSDVYLLNSDKSKSFYQKTLIDSVSNVRLENIEKVVRKEPGDFLTRKSLEYSSPVEDKRTNVDDHSLARKNIAFSLMNPIWNLKRKENKEINHGSLLFENLLHDLSIKDTANADNATDYDQEPKADEKYSFILGLSLVGAVCFFVVNAMFFGFTVLVVCAFAQEIQSKAPFVGL